MLIRNIIQSHIKSYTHIQPFIKEYRSHLLQCMTAVRNVFSKEQPLIEAQTLKNTLLREKKKMDLFQKKKSEFLGFYSFVNDNIIAGEIAKEIMKSVKKNKATVIEINPGMGKITTHLLHMGVKKILHCDDKQYSLCVELQQQYKNNIKVHYYDTNLIKSFDELLPKYVLDNKNKYNIIVMVNVNRILIRYLLERIALVDINLLANSELYLLMAENIHTCFDSPTGCKAETLDYGFINVVYDVQVLAEFPRSAVLPPSRFNISKMYYIQLKRKKKPLVPLSKIRTYWNFVNILSKRKNTRVIAFLERWIPGCGPLLIAKGVTIFTKIHELSKSDLLLIFRCLLRNNNSQFAMKILEKGGFSLKENFD